MLNLALCLFSSFMSLPHHSAAGYGICYHHSSFLSNLAFTLTSLPQYFMSFTMYSSSTDYNYFVLTIAVHPYPSAKFMMQLNIENTSTFRATHSSVMLLVHSLYIVICTSFCSNVFIYFFNAYFHPLFICLLYRIT